jgi:hypothetical protein
MFMKRFRVAALPRNPTSHIHTTVWGSSTTDSTRDYSLLFRLYEGPLLFVQKNFYCIKTLTTS